MPEQDPEPETTEATVGEPTDDDKVLDDLEPAEEEAAGIDGGQRTTAARWHGRL